VTEKLNLLEGRPTNHDRDDRGTLLTIARHVPRSLVNQAMADTQDRHQRALANSSAMIGVAKYFTACIRTQCERCGIPVPFANSRPLTAEPSAT
jgi:hypothetical protein